MPYIIYGVHTYSKCLFHYPLLFLHLFAFTGIIWQWRGNETDSQTNNQNEKLNVVGLPFTLGPSYNPNLCIWLSPRVHLYSKIFLFLCIQKRRKAVVAIVPWWKINIRMDANFKWTYSVNYLRVHHVHREYIKNVLELVGNGTLAIQIVLRFAS